MKTGKFSIAAIVAAAALNLFAGERVNLWPDGKMPGGGEKPYIEWFDPPAKPNGVCMILVSGGSYMSRCDTRLVKEWREKFTAMGVQCAELAYRVPRPKGRPFYLDAWQDGQRAVRLVRADAQKRGFSPSKIGVISMSAGSHLATLLSTSSLTPAYEPVDDLDKTPCNIDWAIAFAVAYGLTDGEGIPNTTGGDGEGVALSPEFKFDAATAPMCLLHGGADKYSPIVSARIYERLRRMKIPAELHVYPKKGHGAFGFERGVEFMRQMGCLGPVGKEVDLLKRYAKDDSRSSKIVQDIWPKGKAPGSEAQFCKPYLEWHFPKKRTTDAIQIIWSGGGYGGNSPDSFEVAPARRYLNSKGMTVVTVKYRSPRPKTRAKHAAAWQDVQRAVRIVKSRAKEFKLDPGKIGVMGSSAGGHLSLMAATSSMTRSYEPIDEIDSLPCNVNWAVAIYPAYVLSDGKDGHNKEGGNYGRDTIVGEFAFDKATPPILFVHGDADGYSSMGSVKVWEKLRRMGVQCGVHTLAKRSHCFQKKASPGTGSYTWLGRIEDFLKTQGMLK